MTMLLRPSSYCLLLTGLFGMQVMPLLGAVVDPSAAFRQEKSTTCEQLLNLALDINVDVFEDYPTAIQTAILLTQMPMTISVTDVTVISSNFLRDIQLQISQQAYLCETEPDGKCKRIEAMISSWSADPLALLGDDTRKSIANGGKYSNESIETVVIPFLKKISERIRVLRRRNCVYQDDEKMAQPLLKS